MLLAFLRYRRIWLLGGLAVAALLALPAGELLTDRIATGIAFEDRAAQMRLGEYRDALRLIAAYPWFGVGFGAAPDIDLYIAASSIYLLIAENMGLIGLSAFLVVIAVFYAWTISAWRRCADPQTEAILLAALAAITAALAAGIFDHYFFNLNFPQTIALFWLNIAMAASAALAAQARSEPSG
jgi:O-antigen ligase